MLKKHQLRSNHATVQALKIERIEICRFCSEELKGSNRIRHEKSKHPKELDDMKRAAVKVLIPERSEIVQVNFFNVKLLCHEICNVQ